MSLGSFEKIFVFKKNLYTVLINFLLVLENISFLLESEKTI